MQVLFLLEEPKAGITSFQEGAAHANAVAGLPKHSQCATSAAPTCRVFKPSDLSHASRRSTVMYRAHEPVYRSESSEKLAVTRA